MRSAVAIAILLTLGCGGDAAKTPQGPPPAPVVVGKAVRRTVAVSLHGIGNVEPVASVAVRSRVAGPILKVHIADGAEVVRGQALFTIDPEPFRVALARAESELARDAALLKKAQDDAARYETLVAKEYVTREQYEAATAQAASLAATIRSDEAEVRDAKLALSYCTITSPITGKAGSVMLRQGNLVRASEDPPLVTIVQLRPVNVAFALPEKNLAEIRARAAAGALPVTAKSRGTGGEGHEGRLTFVDNEVDRATGTIRLKAEFPNDDRGLWPGQFVEVDLALAEQVNAVVVPSTAIQVGQQGSFVFVVGGDGTAAIRPVTVDRAIGDETVVASGLDGGETVITDGQLRVVPGAKVVASAGS
ncbi:MAG TPA: efflux RND transporter periplasmic adaptor subunit [Candidatus Polarisedimenticolaceae bacterium]|nr:efflux RND transporter periplasmic adaptor subunit [Candidatus Polarisedimenticolaceae bacterium]